MADIIERSAGILFDEASEIVANLNTVYTGDTTRVRIFRWSGTSTLNAPISSYTGFCISCLSSANYGCQLAMAANSNKIYTRYNNNGTWTAWKSVTPE